MKLIVGLGNPGKEYENTRHNVGFMVVDNYLKTSDWKQKFDGFYCIKNFDYEKVLFLKPTTYMNLSGFSVKKVMEYYNIDIKDILIIQDDLDIEIGKYKLKTNSSSGGHNGIKSIINSLNSDSFARLKVGISHDRSKDIIDYVLGKFSKTENKLLENNYAIFNQIIDSFIKYGIEETMKNFN